MVVADLRAQGRAVIPRTRSRIVLALGAAAGLCLAASGLFRREERALPPGVVAMVGDTPITAEEYARALAAVASDRKGALDRSLQQHVLDRLIDEELLVQAAMQSGMPTRDPLLRGQIASAMIEAIVGERKTPTEAELRAHFDGHKEVFARNGRVRVQALWFTGAEAKKRAEDARARLLSGETATGDAPAIVVPSGSLPQVKLTDYLGANVASAVSTLPVNDVTQPIESTGGVWIVRLLERKDGEIPAFESVRELVAADLRRTNDDEALRRWLERRRHDTHVAMKALP